MVTTGAAVGVGAWVAPSIVSYDRAAAAIGSCGTKPRQVDFSDYGGILTSPITADDGVIVTYTIADPDNVQDAFWAMRVFGGTINGRDNPVITAMSGANGGEGVTVTFTFSTPVQPSFFLVDVDRGNGSWEDSVEVFGSLGSGSNTNPASIDAPGAAVNFVAPNIARGAAPSNSASSEAEVDFQDPIDQLVIRHFDDRPWTGFQWIGIHDLHWC